MSKNLYSTSCKIGYTLSSLRAHKKNTNSDVQHGEKPWHIVKSAGNLCVRAYAFVATAVQSSR